MPFVERNDYLSNLRFLTPLFNKTRRDGETKSVWIGDVFAHDGSAFCVPPVKSLGLTTGYLPRGLYWDIRGGPCVDYNMAGAHFVLNAADFNQRVIDEHFKSPKPAYFNQKHVILGETCILSSSLKDHLYFTRYSWQFNIDSNREKNEAVCTALENKGVALPDVISSGAVFVAPDGYEGPLFLVREEGRWRTVMLGGSFRHDINSSGWKIPAPTHVLFPTLDGYIKEPAHGFHSPTFFKETVSDTTIEKIINYELIDLLKKRNLSEKDLDTFIHESRNKTLFRIAGHVLLGRKTGSLSDALLISAESEKTTYDGYAVESYLVPIERQQDPKGILDVVLRTDKTHRATIAVNGEIEKIIPASLPSKAADLLESRLACKRPTWDMPLTVTVARDSPHPPP